MNKFILKSIIPSFMLSLLCLLASPGCSNKSSERHLSKEELLASGLEALRVFNFSRSYEIFQQLHDSVDRQDTKWPLITYSYAISSWLVTPANAENVSLAEQLLKELLEQAPKSIYSASALLDLGRIAEISDFRGDPTDVATARAYYKRVRAEFPKSEMSTRATLFLAQTYAQTLQTDEILKAIDLLEACIEEQANEEWIGLISQYVGDLYNYYLDQPDKSVDPLLQATQAGLPREADTDTVLWRIGVLAENAGRDQIAAKAYTQIIQNYPRTAYRTVSLARLEHIQNKYPSENILLPDAPKD